MIAVRRLLKRKKYLTFALGDGEYGFDVIDVVGNNSSPADGSYSQRAAVLQGHHNGAGQGGHAEQQAYYQATRDTT